MLLPWSREVNGLRLRTRDRCLLIAARTHFAPRKNAALSDPLEGVLEGLLGIGLEHNPLARPPAPAIHLFVETRRKFLLVVVSVEFGPQVDVKLCPPQRQEVF